MASGDAAPSQNLDRDVAKSSESKQSRSFAQSDADTEIAPANSFQRVRMKRTRSATFQECPQS